VIRLVEMHGARGTARLRLGFPFQEARSCNLLEDSGPPLPAAEGTVEVGYRPHQVITLLIR
jgi:alpha-mannosidase